MSLLFTDRARHVRGGARARRGAPDASPPDAARASAPGGAPMSPPRPHARGEAAAEAGDLVAGLVLFIVHHAMLRNQGRTDDAL